MGALHKFIIRESNDPLSNLVSLNFFSCSMGELWSEGFDYILKKIVLYADYILKKIVLYAFMVCSLTLKTERNTFSDS